MPAVTGTRVGEAIAAHRGDLDLTTGRLTVRFGKFRMARELALYPSTVDALGAISGYVSGSDRARTGHRNASVVRLPGRDRPISIRLEASSIRCSTSPTCPGS